MSKCKELRNIFDFTSMDTHESVLPSCIEILKNEHPQYTGSDLLECIELFEQEQASYEEDELATVQ